jgi:hypothetical protein
MDDLNGELLEVLFANMDDPSLTHGRSTGAHRRSEPSLQSVRPDLEDITKFFASQVVLSLCI